VTQHRVTKPEGLHGAAAVAHFGVLALALGYTAMIAIHRPPLAAMIGGSPLSTQVRAQLMSSLALWTVVAAALMAAGLVWARRHDRGPTSAGDLAAELWPLTLLPVAWYVFDIAAWSASPVLLYAVASAAVGYCVIRTELPPARHHWRAWPRVRAAAPRATVVLGIAAYVGYVSTFTICNHHSLGTAAFDLGIQENVLWNTTHGNVLYSSLMHGHYLGVHTSLVLLLVAPLFAAVPTAETLLVLQTAVLAAAAWPLYLLARTALDSEAQAVVIALLWLSHPAVAGANFYDFHPVAFAPLFLFSAWFFWFEQRWRPFWVCIALVLTVKEELAILVVLIGIVTLLNGARRQGWLLVGVGATAFVVLQHVVIPHFAGGAHSYSWYYADLIPAGEGPRGLLTTLLLNPVFTLGFALTGTRLLYVFQLFSPLAFLPFVTARGWVLVSYGLAATLLASRPPLHQIGFQYALSLLAMGFAAAILALAGLSLSWRRRALAAAVMLAVVTCYHYGMIWPRHNFTGGFHTIDFDYTDEEKRVYRELMDLVKAIPPEATVLASEDLVPHVAGRRIIETERYALTRAPLRFDVVLVHNDGSAQRMREVPYLGGLRDYDVVHTEHFVMFTRR
jgi:uncharacterized membrane protein